METSLHHEAFNLSLRNTRMCTYVMYYVLNMDHWEQTIRADLNKGAKQERNVE